MSLLEKLTVREREVMYYISQGRSNKEISLELGISIYTVHNHVQRIFSKLETRSRVEVARIYWLLSDQIDTVVNNNHRQLELGDGNINTGE